VDIGLSLSMKTRRYYGLRMSVEFSVGGGRGDGNYSKRVRRARADIEGVTEINHCGGEVLVLVLGSESVVYYANMNCRLALHVHLLRV